ncbi:MAG: phosphoribosylformylglycinamidine cyclo-ligase [Bdellovibrionales bacterium]|jgi:phosphoribosylformylglycinamidine cyclo-ligase|nr:phosphoribosylformylglycinamidine cyclo-ligase [Bdellovibrionales bacterium]MBT3524745.1 phosphoribosylformylglycinamidine cyclo-ligase [Bdellovibrionales bacterium]MBT7670054.1 phosphoribosylformylglycinamidine cyclo-ligase [Bdellovibrionales bacterium]MBT7767704.1 phosphoribosylformylglycinamidine cyclo-ligase [Bdellovibrionales bacterium]
MSAPIDYKSAGVDIDAGEQLVKKIKQKVRATCGERVVSGVGGFASLYQISDDKLLAAGSDGVGTKLKIAQQLNLHNTIGIDLVAMCANDIICTGATPLFFLDYLAMGKIDLTRDEAIIDGIVEGCRQAEMALIGGETAEMPGSYPQNEYDLAGFAIGEVKQNEVINGAQIKEGESLIGIASSGFHSNGFSLLRKLVGPTEHQLLTQLLTPTTIYQTAIKTLLNQHRPNIKGVAHITGGGIHNIGRLNSNFNYQIDSLPSLEEIPSCFKTIVDRAKLPLDQLYSTFNMGIGMVIISDQPATVQASLSELGYKTWIVGQVIKGSGKVTLPS